MDERLRWVAQEGNTNELYRRIQEDPDVLDRLDEAEFVDTPLHIAAAEGHVDFARAIIFLKPSFASKLNQDVYSPIHLALQNGHKEMVFCLLKADKDLVRIKGKEGYTAFHQAVDQIQNLEFVRPFLRDCPECMEDVTIRNETALHIAVKNDRPDALQVLVRWLQRTHIYGKVSKKHLLNSKDGDDNTVLHIAAIHAKPQMIKLLLECKVNLMEINMGGLTALDILERRSQSEDRDICLKLLRGKGALNAPSTSRAAHQQSYKRLQSKIKYPERIVMGLVGPIMSMPPDRINTLLLGLTLLITAVYQAILTPPGGVQQGNIAMNATEAAGVGNSVADSATFQVCFVVNHVVFLFSVITVVVLIQFVTDSSLIGIIAEVLVAMLTCSFLSAMRVIVPHKAYFLRDTLHVEAAPVYFFLLLFFMEGNRRLCLVFKRWYHEV